MNEWTFANEINLTPINLPRAALQFTKDIAYPHLQIPAYLQKLRDLALEVEDVLPPRRAALERAVLAAEQLFGTSGFRGNAEDYGDPRNSYLNEVLDRRLGIPISLSVVYLSIAKRLDIPAFGVGLPGHFIVGVRDGRDTWYLDPFHGGGRLSINDCARLVESTTGYSGSFQMEWLAPLPPRQILARMLHNLRVVYVQRRDWDHAAAVIRHLQLVEPHAAEHLRDLGLVYYRKQAWRLAARYLESYLRQEPNAPDAETIRSGMREALDSWARMN